LTLIDKTKLFNLCFKPLFFTIITSSLHCYSYQKDERATPGNIVTKWCPPLRQKIASITSPITLPFVCSSTVSLSLSLSHTHTLSLSHSHTHTHTHTLSLSLSLTLCLCQPSGWGSACVRNVQWPAFSMKISLDFSRLWSQCWAATKFHADGTRAAYCADPAPRLYAHTKIPPPITSPSSPRMALALHQPRADTGWRNT
jgi:hypothetical protein